MANKTVTTATETEKATKLNTFYNNATEAEKDAWIEDTFNDDFSDEDYRAKYEFSKSGAWKYIARIQKERMTGSMAQRYDIREGKGFVPKKVTLQMSEETQAALLAKADSMSKETCFLKYFCVDAIIRAGLRALQ